MLCAHDTQCEVELEDLMEAEALDLCRTYLYYYLMAQARSTILILLVILLSECQPTINTLPTFQVLGNLGLTGTAGGYFSKTIIFTGLNYTGVLKKVEACLSLDTNQDGILQTSEKCNIQNWIDITSSIGALSGPPSQWANLSLLNNVNGGSFALNASCITISSYFISVRLTDSYGKIATLSTSSWSFWSPSCISSLSLWLDANDSSTITFTSGYVSQWSDKSGNLNHAAQGTLANMPSYQTNALNRGSVVTFPTNSAYLVGLQNGTYQSVIAVRNLPGTTWQTLFASPANTDFSLRADTNFGVSNTWYTSGGGGFPNANDWPVGIAGPPYAVWVNGTQTVTAITPYHILMMNSNPAVSASNYSISTTFIGRGMYNNAGVAELAATSSTLSTSDQQKMEGYLAWKWGLEGSLPSGHPYLNAPP